MCFRKNSKNGVVRGKTRYKCKLCGYNFTEGDARVNDKLIVKKALAVILDSLGKGIFWDACPYIRGVSVVDLSMDC